MKEKSLIDLKISMMRLRLKPGDVSSYFGWGNQYTSELLNGKCYASKDQIQKVKDALPEIAKQKQGIEEAA